MMDIAKETVQPSIMNRNPSTLYQLICLDEYNYEYSKGNSTAIHYEQEPEHVAPAQMLR